MRAFVSFFYSNEGDPRETVHIHVRQGSADAKFWVIPEVSLAESFGFKTSTLNELLRIIELNRSQIIEAWYDHFSD